MLPASTQSCKCNPKYYIDYQFKYYPLLMKHFTTSAWQFNDINWEEYS